MRVLIRSFILLVLISGLTIGPAQCEPLQNLTDVGTFTTSEPHDAEFYKDYMFIADGNSLLVYNVSNPEKPGLLNKMTDFDKVYGISILEERLYMASGPGWIYVLNISDPENPTKLQQITYLDNANDVAVTEKYMYVADTNTGLLIFNFNDQTNPELSGMFYVLKSNISGTLQGWAGISIEVSGNYVFLSAEKRVGFYIVDVSDPESPKEVFHSLGKNVYDIAIRGNDVYLSRADGTSEYNLLDVSNPYAPNNTGTFFINEIKDRAAIAVHPSGDYIYAASGDTWHIFKVPDTIPPQIIIDRPQQGEIFSNQVINISGTASDKNDIKEVLVNGNFSGTKVWDQRVKLQEGTNNITITAWDTNGNNITESIQVVYRPQAITPMQTITSSPSPKETPEIIKDTVKKPVSYNVILIAMLFLITIAFIYWITKLKK
ncbi:MAG: LVIVD repeat protein [Candidatus Methanoperedens nitroreducens]|uniref:LVIVD repeat protein n=1 Tax=Candidatus Methanoperedens nitratireducens TaxID=1392998 RepID=A0A0P8DY11_9EURY|nr:Ig-like domain-containing protein [Candidatus Methanoperedens sp. BLZ2]KAB2942442.1 MAG: hypothetical protein F9K14_17045 [Candidatus Methanoperedens sp.]KPQ42623.1 MAG: LVIVD repeat protein [Candidatus Methanoperedens sp. BLZ1]MBZ0177126.1 hypothetical protein [Candidatus Methanoperedens nitroreducens]MCX9077557.1 Ig-like domain-containing protein [Candidatus Methanoperedens sp.]